MGGWTGVGGGGGWEWDDGNGSWDGYIVLLWGWAREVVRYWEGYNGGRVIMVGGRMMV